MMLNEHLFRKQVHDWIDEYAREHPEDDADVVRDRLEDAAVQDFDTPTDFLEQVAREQAPSFYRWWTDKEFKSSREEVGLMRDAYEQEYATHRADQIQALSEGAQPIVVSPTDRIVDLLQRDAAFRPLLERVVAVERAGHGDDPEDDANAGLASRGWGMDDIAGLRGSHVDRLVDAGVVRPVDRGDGHRRFRADDEAIAEALKVHDMYRAEADAARESQRVAEREEWRALWREPCPVCRPHSLLDHATEKDMNLLRENLARVGRGEEPDLPDSKMICLKCECFISRTAAFTRVLEAATKTLRPVLRSVSANVSSRFLEDVRVDSEDVERFEGRLKAQDGVEYGSEAVAPKIVGLAEVKRALLIALASLPDAAGDRNRIHVLLWGEPGTAKTELVREVIRFGGGWADHGTSDVGLTADASGDELVPGLLPANHGGAVGIDELDKFANRDQNGVLEAMETGEVTVNRGPFVNVRLPAEAIVVATANRLDKLRPELVSRFDLTIRLAVPTVQEARAIMDDRIVWWNRPKGKATADLAKFLAWVRGFTPNLSESVRAQARALMNDYVLMSGETRVRRLERTIRIAIAIARLNHRDVVLQDFKRAIGMLHQAQSDNDGA